MVSRYRMSGHAAPKPTMDDFVATRQRMEHVSAEFLKTDLATALILMRIARESGEGSRKRRNYQAARKAYNTILKLSRKVKLSSEDGLSVTRGLDELKTELEELGQTL